MRSFSRRAFLRTQIRSIFESTAVSGGSQGLVLLAFVPEAPRDRRAQHVRDGQLEREQQQQDEPEEQVLQKPSHLGLSFIRATGNRHLRRRRRGVFAARLPASPRPAPAVFP